MKCTQVADSVFFQWRIMLGDCVISTVRRDANLERTPMKLLHLSLAILCAFLMYAPHAFSQEQASPDKRLSVSEKLDAIVNRLQAIEDRLKQLEGEDKPLAFTFGHPFKIDGNRTSVIHWRNPRSVSNPIDEAMQIDEIERRNRRIDRSPIDLYRGAEFKNENSVTIEPMTPNSNKR